MRHRLHELLADTGRSGTDTGTARRRAGRAPVPSAEGGSAGADRPGTRSSEPDPQRARSTGSTHHDELGAGRDRGSRFGGAGRGDETGDTAGSGPDRFRGGGRNRGTKSSRSGRTTRRADPVVAGSVGDARETEAGTSRSTPGRIPHGGTVEQAKETCLRLLAVRARSRAELAQRLAGKGYTAEITAVALERLTEVGLIDDAAFAEQWVSSRHTSSGKGKQALAQELRRKGVAPEDSAAALSAVSDDDEHARATELVRRKLRTLPRDLEHDKALRRLVGMLARRGYSQSMAFTVVKAELGAL